MYLENIEKKPLVTSEHSSSNLRFPTISELFIDPNLYILDPGLLHLKSVVLKVSTGAAINTINISNGQDDVT